MVALNTFENTLLKAKYIIGQNNYMIIATADNKGRPWASVVFYAHDVEYNFYFLSTIEAQHAENIKENRNVALAIFNSTQRIGSVEEVQISGTASLVSGSELKRAILIYCNKLFPKSDVSPTERYRPEDYSEPSKLRFFKVEVEKAYATGQDRREEVDLKD